MPACGRLSFDALSDDGAGPDASVTVVGCPTGYVLVPDATPFCVAKYEMKLIDGSAASVPQEQPWTSLHRDEAIAACRALGPGYDLITNAQWQVLASRIADDGNNWSGGAPSLGILSIGHSDSDPAWQLDASTDDDPCFGTANTCSPTNWSSQRRAMTIGTQDVVWDVGGNSLEWVQDDYTKPAVGDALVAELMTGDSRIADFGTTLTCGSATADPYCGFGIIYSKEVGGTIVRGGGLDWTETGGGVFTAALWLTPVDDNWNIGFRCTWRM